MLNFNIGHVKLKEYHQNGLKPVFLSQICANICLLCLFATCHKDLIQNILWIYFNFSKVELRKHPFRSEITEQTSGRFEKLVMLVKLVKTGQGRA